MLRAAIRDPDPVLFLEHKKSYRAVKGDVPDGSFEVPIGRADVKREADLTVVSYGMMLHVCLEAAARLAEEDGVSAEVVDVRTIAPLDSDTILDSVRKTGKAMVVYEDNRTYGAGAEIASMISRRAFDLDARPPPRWPGCPRDAVRDDPRACLPGVRSLDLGAHARAGAQF